MQRMLSLLALLSACGGAQSGRDSAAHSHCVTVAAHLVQLAMEDNHATERPADMDGVEQELVRQCESTPWSKERRSCVLLAKTQDATLGCPIE